MVDALRSRACKGRCVQMWPAARWLWRRGRCGCIAPLRPPRACASPRTPSWSTARASRAARRAGLLAAVPQNRPGHGHALLAACGRSWRLHACPPSIVSIQPWQAHLASATWSYLQRRRARRRACTAREAYAPQLCLGRCRVAPYALEYPGSAAHLAAAGLAADSGLWREVHDFCWLRAAPSPNWCAAAAREGRAAPEGVGRLLT